MDLQKIFQTNAYFINGNTIQLKMNNLCSKKQKRYLLFIKTNFLISKIFWDYYFFLGCNKTVKQWTGVWFWIVVTVTSSRFSVCEAVQWLLISLSSRSKQTEFWSHAEGGWLSIRHSRTSSILPLPGNESSMRPHTAKQLYFLNCSFSNS